MILTYSQHQLSAAFPSMSDEDFGALVEDIRQHGQRDPAVVIGHEVLDGWHRVMACEELGIEPEVVEYDGDDPQSFVLSKNLFRRQLDAGQRARAVVLVYEWIPVGSNQHRGSALVADPHDEGRHPVPTLKSESQNEGRHPVPTLKSESQMASDAKVSTRTIRHAKAAERAGLGEAISDGKISAKAAAEIAKRPELAAAVVSGEISLPDAIKQISPPKPAPESAPDEYDGAPDEAEIQVSLEAEAADRRTLELILAADDKLAAAYAEIKRLNAEISVLKGQRNQYQNEAAEWKRRAKRAERDAERAARTNGAAHGAVP